MKSAGEYDALTVGQRIKTIRAAFGVSQSQLALICKVSPAAVGNWEQGRARPTLVQGAAMVEAFDVTLDYIYLGRDHTLKHSVATVLENAQGRRSSVN